MPDALPPFTDAELEPVTTIDGIPNPLPGVYTDMGPAPAEGEFRSLIAFGTRNKAVLEETVKHMYDPAHPNFRKYMTQAEWMAAHAPNEVDVQLVRLWLESQGFAVNFTATNRLLIEFTGTVQQFNDVFHTTLHIFERENPQIGNPPIDVFGTLEPLEIPLWVATKIRGVISADLAAEKGVLPPEGGGVVVQAPPSGTNWMTPAKIAKAYKLDSLYSMGYRGQGVKLGVTVGATFKYKDLQSFWQSLNVVRNDPTIVQTMEPFVTRYIESTLDVEWAGAMAPDSDLIVYSGPDARNTSMIYTFNEAIARNEVDVITNSFAHREDSEPALVRLQYSDSALQAAAYGITVVAATGDSGGADTPSVSPWVTGVGGTRLTLNANGSIQSEVAWQKSGCGTSLTLLQPDWQVNVVGNANGKRATADLALNADPGTPYYVYYLAQWKLYGGTSFSSPVFAGLMATVDSYRKANNLPRAGYLNSLLYTNADIKKTFRDITSGGPGGIKTAGVGWDYPSGWGAPSALGLATTIP
ncbi:S53 family peptidase [Polyangium aurulentum]|uniref:S53 family peptidase n=1 Tax=Polyangium aurulentum TaxID=2567896 RepID=UPI001F251C90|nr:S53 family serine peptidase [Polyangium aurulentum]